MEELDEKAFRQILQLRLGASWDRALTLFRNYGDDLGFDVANVLLHAVDQGKVEEVLGILERYFDDHLKYQHPHIRGQIVDRFLGVNPTQDMFVRICQQTLGLTDTPE